MKKRRRKAGSGAMIDRGWRPIQVWIRLGEQTRLLRLCRKQGCTMAGFVRRQMLAAIAQSDGQRTNIPL
jgi:hypothetical protein